MRQEMGWFSWKQNRGVEKLSTACLSSWWPWLTWQPNLWGFVGIETDRWLLRPFITLPSICLCPHKCLSASLRPCFWARLWFLKETCAAKCQKLWFERKTMRCGSTNVERHDWFCECFCNFIIYWVQKCDSFIEIPRDANMTAVQLSLLVSVPSPPPLSPPPANYLFFLLPILLSTVILLLLHTFSLALYLDSSSLSSLPPKRPSPFVWDTGPWGTQGCSKTDLMDSKCPHKCPWPKEFPQNKQKTNFKPAVQSRGLLV